MTPNDALNYGAVHQKRGRDWGITDGVIVLCHADSGYGKQSK